MAIHYIPNDPRAGQAAPALRQQAKRATRPASRSGFVYSQTHPEGVAAPGTPPFLFWQAREAAIAALQAWEACAGKHTAWQGHRRKLPLHQDEGEDLNAFYDRATFSFFHQKVGATTFFSGASTDVVAHEIGHGLLDSVRPDLWDISFLEVGAFHEAFGDCMALLTALEDGETRVRLLAQAPTLRKRNFVESIAEDLSRGIGRAIPGHNAAEPRHAFNRFQFQIPSTLPADGGPGKLINEVHSFGMIFSGCFWDLLANLFAASARKTEEALLAAARLTGKLVIAGVKGAVVTPRFTQALGRAITLADQSLHGGANHAAIRDAFARHGLLLGSNALLAPSAALAGAAPRGATLDAATRKDLLQRLGGARGATLAVSAGDVFGTPVVTALHTRPVALGTLHPQLRGVVALTPEPVMVGASGARAAVMGSVPQAGDTESEVHAFVESLLSHHRIAFGGTAATARGAPAVAARDHTTHEIRTVRGKKVLRRKRFMCFCHGGAPTARLSGT